MKDLEFGTIRLHLDELMKDRNISISKLSYRAEMQRTQLKKYCRNEVQRLDIAVLSRLCYALDCDLHDLLEYILRTQKLTIGFAIPTLSQRG